MTGNSILDSLGREEAATVLKHSEKVVLDVGSTITRPGDPVVFIIFPVDAVISHYQILKDGRTAEIGLTGSEGMVGEGAALTPRESEYFSEVLVSGEAFRIDAEAFRRVAAGSSACRKAVFNYLNEDIERTSRRVICNNHHSVEERMALWLLLVRDRCKCDSLPFTQEQVSFFLGVHRPSVTLAMQDLREKGIVDYSRGKIQIIDPERLHEASCSCYESLAVRGVDARADGSRT